jgi:hypothetical protein
MAWSLSLSTTINSTSAAPTTGALAGEQRRRPTPMMTCPSSALLCSLAATFVSQGQSHLERTEMAKLCTANGYFNAYGNAARKDNHDWVIHLGDYIYETAREGERATIPDRTLFTLHDYRSRHGQVRTHFPLFRRTEGLIYILSIAPTSTYNFFRKTLHGSQPGTTMV